MNIVLKKKTKCLKHSYLNIHLYRINIDQFIYIWDSITWWHIYVITSSWNLKLLNFMGKDYRFTRSDELSRGKTLDSWNSFTVIMATCNRQFQEMCE